VPDLPCFLLVRSASVSNVNHVASMRCRLRTVKAQVQPQVENPSISENFSNAQSSSKQALLDGTYRPLPVREKEIPQPDGGIWKLDQGSRPAEPLPTAKAVHPNIRPHGSAPILFSWRRLAECAACLPCTEQAGPHARWVGRASPV